MMNIVLLILILLMLTLMSMHRTEKFTEKFGMSGYTKPVHYIIINDEEVDLSQYRESEEDIEVSNDLMQKMVLATNKEISKRTGLCTYIIETTSIKKYISGSGQDLYKCMFMSVKHKGFALGFSVSADIRITDGEATVVSLRTQPIDSRPPSDPSIYQKTIKGKEFEDYSKVRQSELDIIKTKGLTEKVIPEPRTMYGKIRI